MAKIDEIKAKLRVGELAERKYVTEQQLNEAAADLIKRTSVRKQDLEYIGEKVAQDPHVFSATDTDDLNDILGRLGEK
jgi:hypothetical protein